MSSVTAFADDTFTTTEANSLGDLKEKTESEGEKILVFFASNRMVVNPSKTGLLVFRPTSSQHDQFSCRLGGEEITESPEEKILGVIVDNELKWSSHVQKLKNECNYHLSILRRIRRVLSANQTKMIANGMIMSRIRYCLAIHGAEQLRVTQDDKLTGVCHQMQLIQNEMLRIIFNHKKCDRVKITDMLESADMLSVNQLIGYSILMEAWKSKNFEIPHLSDLLKYERNDDRTLRSNSTNSATSSVIEPFASCARKLWNLATPRFRTTNLVTVAKIESRKLANSLPVM